MMCAMFASDARLVSVFATDMKNYIYASFLTSSVILSERSAAHSENSSHFKVEYLEYGKTHTYVSNLS